MYFEVTITLKFDIEADDEQQALVRADGMASDIDVATLLNLDADEVDIDAEIAPYSPAGSDAADHTTDLAADRTVGL